MKENKFIPVVIIIAFILIVYAGLFSGANFFVDDDCYVVYNYAHGNAIGNGWRPEKGLGISFFYGDPGLWHPWSIYTLWERFCGSSLFAYNSSIIILFILAAVSQYCLLKKITPNLGIGNVFLSLLIVFNSLQHEFFFQRHWIALTIGTPLLIIILNDYFSRPRLLSVFLSSFLFWAVWFMGSFASFCEMIITGVLFSILYYLYHKKTLKEFLLRMTFLYSFSLFILVLLGAWIFYSVYIERCNIEYIREIGNPVINGAPFLSMNKTAFFYWVTNFFHSGWLSPFVYLAPGNFIFTFSWANVSMVFPFIFLFFLFNRAKDFWEFSLKWCVVVFLLAEFWLQISPLTFSVMQSLLNGYPLIKFQPAYHCLQLGLIAVFISKLCEGSYEISNITCKKIIKAVAIILSLFYCFFVVVSIFAFVKPEFLPDLAGIFSKRFIPDGFLGYPGDLTSYILSFDIKQIQYSIHWYSLLFYLSSLFISLLFVNDKWISKISGKPKAFIALFILINGILLSWTVYPLNKRDMVWNKAELSGVLAKIQPVNRFYSFDEPDKQKTGKSIESFKKNWIEKEGKPVELWVGYDTSPGLNLSGTKSFTQKDVAEFLFHAFSSKAGDEVVQSIRNLRRGSFISSGLLDLSALTYYFCSRVYPDPPDGFILYYKAQKLCIYKNLKAWPYYYLAEKLEVIDSKSYPESVIKGTAYVDEKDFFALKKESNSSVKLKEFSYGKIVFDCFGSSDNFLVIADAWHPFWKADINGKDIPVCKANKIFKGIKLPAGRYSLLLYYDVSSYKSGIFISVASWVIFIIIFILLLSKEKVRKQMV